MGRVYLDRYSQGDTVIVEDLSGNQISQLSTNSSGVLYDYNLSLPADFRIRAL